MYRLIPHPVVTRPAALALAPRRERIEDAVADMGTGAVIDAEDGHLVAFHERHLAYLERREAPSAP